MKEKPRVSVICITYGHEDYIAKALDSFLMQKTDFPYQILVGEDNGPDRTAEIVMSYAEKYPDIIIPFIRKENMGAQRNLIDLCSRAETEYLAFCEGDDYWTDENKLQKQFDLMESRPEYRMCFHNTMIMADSSWYLYDYYKKDKNDIIYIPESIPQYDTSLTEMRTDYYIQFGPAHTSSLFYRWDYNKEIPEWYYRHIYGDHSLVMIQVGDGLIGYIPETMSVYRRSEVGVLMYETKTDHFLKSRRSWIEMAVDIEQYYLKHYGLFANTEIRKRIVQEFNNYIRSIINADKVELLDEAYRDYAYPASLAMEETTRCKNAINKLKQLYSEEGLNMLMTDKAVQEEISKAIGNRKKKKREKIRDRIKGRLDAYVKDNKDLIEKTLWVFGHEDQRYYCGNARHLYEYILAYHPEIEAVWLTKNNTLIKLFESEGMPYKKIGTEECALTLEKASVAFVNSYKTQAFDIKGFNKDTKIVRLGDGVLLTEEQTLYSFDCDLRMIPSATAEEIIKKDTEKYDEGMLTEETRGYFTENYSNTFLQIAENDRTAQYYIEHMGVPKEAVFICGSPRTFAQKDNPKDVVHKILLCPGVRANGFCQREYMRSFTEQIEIINELLEREDVYLTIKIPDNYEHGLIKTIRERTEQYSRIEVLRLGTDLYADLINYDAMITDWSSAMFDFAMQDKPVVLLISENETTDIYSWIYNYEDVAPGKKATDWKEAFILIIERIKEPTIDRDKRKRALERVYDMTVNDEKNSERIIAEVKRRLDIQ